MGRCSRDMVKIIDLLNLDHQEAMIWFILKSKFKGTEELL